MRMNIEVDTDAGTARIVGADGNTLVTSAAPPLLDFDFEVGPKIVNGLIAEDFWMVGRTGAQKGALAAHWTQYNQIVTMMGGVTEFDVVCAPNPASAAEMNPSNYNICVHHAWEPRVGWLDEAPPGMDDPDGAAKYAQQWADYYARFRAARGK